MATTRFYLDLRGKAKDGKGSLQIQVYHNGTTALIPTGVRLAPNEWNGSYVQKVLGAEAINASLQETKSKIDRKLAILSFDERYQHMTASEIKTELSEQKIRRSKDRPISEIFSEYTESGDLKEGTKAIYRSTLKKVIAYSGDIKINCIDLKWLRGFEKFMSKAQGINGRAIYLRSLHAVCGYALHTGVITTHPFDSFTIKHEETKKRSIPPELLMQFKNFPTSASNAMYRDYFFLMLYFIGINTIDLLLAKKSQVKEGRFDYIRAKTGKKYSIKIEPEAEELLRRYEGKGDYLLEAMDHCKHYRSFAHQINDALKFIGNTIIEEVPVSDDLFGGIIQQKTIVPVIPEISTYSARHTWATLAYEAGVSFDIISQALGHSQANRTTLIYVKFDQKKVDDANRTVIDYLKQAELH